MTINLSTTSNLQVERKNNLVRRVRLENSLVTTVAGSLSGTVGINNMGSTDGQGSAASFYFPRGIDVDATGTYAIVADAGNHLLRRIDLSSGLVTTVAGRRFGVVGINNQGYADGKETAASFDEPKGVAFDSTGTFALIVRRAGGWCGGFNADW